MSGGECGDVCSCMIVLLQGWTPLHWAVHSGSGECITLLVDAGADIHAKNKYGETPGDMEPNMKHMVAYLMRTLLSRERIVPLASTPDL